MTVKRQPSILHFFSRLEPGGAELRTIELVNQMGVRADFYATSGQPGRLEEKLVRQGHGVHHGARGPNGVFKLLVTLRRNRYDVVHSHLGAASGAILLVAAVIGTRRRIVHFRSDQVGGAQTLRKKFLLGISRISVHLFATDIIGVSPGSLFNGWKSNWPQDPRCIVIPNGLDQEKLLARSENDSSEHGTQQGTKVVEVANIGRVEVTKNRGRAISIWHDFHKKTESNLFLIGELNNDDDWLARKLKSNQNDAHTVKILGDTERVPELLGRMDVLLVTSKREGLPGVVLEALALGVPVVATDLPGVRWISSKLPGVFIRSLNQPNSAWCEAIHESLSANAEEIRAGFRASPFTLERVIPQFEKIWGLVEPSEPQQGARR